MAYRDPEQRRATTVGAGGCSGRDNPTLCADGWRPSADGRTPDADGCADGPTRSADDADGRAPHPSGSQRRARTWRCTGCRALQFAPTAAGQVRCSGCGSTTDESGRVICLDCHRPAEDGQRRRCVACVQKGGGAA
jgi:LSD1 subclass zinc finger protein